jgi:hypothetical protein
MYADDRYADDHMAAPPHMGQLQQQQPGNYSPQSFATAEVHHGGMQDQRAISPVQPMPASVVYAPPQPLPTFQPMSPLMSPVTLHDDMKASPAAATAAARAQPYDDDSSRMYDEVARAAGVPSPVPAQPLSPTMQSPQQGFLPPVMPYQHGIPLSPLTEVPTPASTNVSLMPDAGVPEASVVSVAQRVTAPMASPSIVSAAPAPRPLPAIPQQPKAPSPTDSAPAPAPAPSSAPNQAPARPDSMDDAYGGI